MALTVGVLLAGLTAGKSPARQSAARQTRAHAATVPSTLFGDFKQLDLQLTTAIQKDQQADRFGFPILWWGDVTELETTTLALGDRYMQAPVYGVAANVWFDTLAKTERYLNLAAGLQTGRLVYGGTPVAALNIAQQTERTLVNTLKASGHAPSSVLADFRSFDGLITTAIDDAYSSLTGPQIGHIAGQVVVLIHRSMLAPIDGIRAFSWAGWLIAADTQLYRAYLMLTSERTIPGLGGVTPKLEDAQKAERALNHLLHKANPTPPTTATSTTALG